MMIGWVLAAAVLLGSAVPGAMAATAPVMTPAPIAYASVDWFKTPLRTFYADPNGGGTGQSRSSPRALGRLLPGLKPGDRIILLAGTYPSAKVTAHGTALRPIRIEAEHPVVAGTGHQVATSRKAVFRNSSLQIDASSYLRITGLSFEVDPSRGGSGITATNSDHLAFTRNYFFQQTNYGVLLGAASGGDVSQVLLENNVFRNMIVGSEAGGVGGVRMDYGQRVHRTRTMVVRNNHFDGYFNHSVSLKEIVRDVLIERNSFRICGLVCVEGGQEPDTTHPGGSTDRKVANVVIRSNSFSGLQDGSMGVFARNVERIFIIGNQFSGITEPLRMASNDRNSKSCERQLYLVGRKLGGCEVRSRLTQIGRKNSGVLFDGNKISGGIQFIMAGRGYPGDFLSIKNAANTSPIEICLRPFIQNGADFNSWTEGTPATFAPPALYRDIPIGFSLKSGNCTGKDLTHDCEAHRSCTGIND
ncbi:MAG TPA: hypothetical protein VHL31_21430 [Geminicoccus sp.]|jgi:hypothetical protein|uniref:hypothetical protein n=1 Tax=Geminicoccus sp. TaxID=2024832 RepID=UPI002E2F49E2|nr:hypothetical protein [Geminicoccus sp.]HEX2528841.1 hypothetical protein [Geminicoccus sp.]